MPDSCMYTATRSHFFSMQSLNCFPGDADFHFRIRLLSGSSCRSRTFNAFSMVTFENLVIGKLFRIAYSLTAVSYQSRSLFRTGCYAWAFVLHLLSATTISSSRCMAGCMAGCMASQSCAMSASSSVWSWSVVSVGLCLSSVCVVALSLVLRDRRIQGKSYVQVWYNRR